MIEEGSFYNPDKQRLSWEEVKEEIVSYLKEKPYKNYEIVVGCDSSSGEEPTFPLAVVVRRVGEGGRFYLKRVRFKDKHFYFWKERILQEVTLSCELALELREFLEKEKNDRLEGVSFEFNYIHADVSASGDTRDMVKEIIGLIRGNGFEAKIKPESYVASVVADRFS